jgi:hypothetical protein
MNASLLAVLNDAERLLVTETERAGLAALDEDAAIELETRIRRARNKYVGQYRRAASAAVPEHGGRGVARPQNKQAAMKAEAFEEALSRVSRRVATLARQAAAELRVERLAAARAAKQGRGPGMRAAAAASSRKGPAVTGQRTGDRALRSPASEKRRAATAARQGNPPVRCGSPAGSPVAHVPGSTQMADDRMSIRPADLHLASTAAGSAPARPW